MQLLMKKSCLAMGLSLLTYFPGLATTYYVSVSGNDNNTGTSTSSPFATLQKANNVALAGDVIYVRGGTYQITNSHVTYVNANGTTVPESSALYAVGVKFSKSGTTAAPIKYYNYPNESPKFDFSGITKSLRITGMLVTGSNIVLKGFELVNVPVNLAITDTQSECVRNTGSRNKFERLIMHDSEAIGFYLTKGSDNIVLNCDAYKLWDHTSGAQLGENSDGFGFHPAAGGTGNSIKGCRAWFCADDGYDLISAFESVTIENCWAFYNGYSSGYATLANGNGFKGGGYGLTPARLPEIIPNHVIKRCLSVGNRANGFYANHHPGRTTWYNNTAYDNGVNFNMLSGTISGSQGAYTITDCPGYNMRFNNNLAYYSSNSNTHIHASGINITNLNTSSGSTGHNSFNMNSVSVSNSDFQSLNLSQLTLSRASDGSLPVISCLHLANSSDLINAGISASGISYTGSSPDLGCFETSSNKSLEDEYADNTEDIVDLSIYPNPVTAEANFSGIPANSMVEIYDIQGNKLAETTESQLDVTYLIPGVYFVRSCGQSNKFIKK